MIKKPSVSRRVAFFMQDTLGLEETYRYRSAQQFETV